MSGAAESLPAIYIHWPFCRSKCPYCDFNSIADTSVDQTRWSTGLRRALTDAAHPEFTGPIGSIFFGGGTPSLLDPSVVAALIDTVRTLWTTSDALEVTLEANPSTVEMERFGAYADAGVNRLSIGVQSFDDRVLSFLGRTHNAAQARSAIDVGLRYFDNVSIDLIFGWSEHDIDRWDQALSAALAYETGHISLYQLTIEDGTPFGQLNVPVVTSDQSVDLYELACDRLGQAGLTAYEISNFARPERHCRHNLSIWRGSAYLGIGPGAHGRIFDGKQWLATVQTASPNAWLESVESGEGVEKRDSIIAKERGMELILMGLRLDEGLDKKRFQALCGLQLHSVVDGESLASFVEGGMLTNSHTRLRATPSGRLMLDSIVAILFE